VRRRRYEVTHTLKQGVAWVFAATALGLTVPRFLARAGDVYARHLALVKLRRENRADREMGRSLYEARRR
jgi:hypothetical protein